MGIFVFEILVSMSDFIEEKFGRLAAAFFVIAALTIVLAFFT